ncbi:MAG: HIRAN domain-containing protein [Methanobrevibacter sp.]|uniref:HIRAN domain-containing protein n=1 Tax=Methanobrevibacter sp. TaxID=66852 RepID=UPI0025EDE0C9|nr:HIRAN domain-containing protein [Methanobrevibacter sp.]MBR6992940.1 HIRAN domain-containing protein [Methanobrevibacter sp.]
MYITIQSFDKFHGPKPLVLNRLVKLVKEPNNKYDAEAIACEMRHFGKIGYLSNSVNTVVLGTMSSGRLYDKISDEYIAKIKFIHGSICIAKVLSTEEFTEEVKNPESDIHYLFDDLTKLHVEEKQ